MPTLNPLARAARWKAVAVLVLAAALALVATPTAHAAQTTTTTVTYTDTTATRGTPFKTWYEGAWSSNSTHTWATEGAQFEVAFTGESFVMYGRRSSTNGTADVYVDDVKVGTANYNGSRSSTIEIFRYEGLTPGDHTLRVVTVGWINHASVEFTSTVQTDGRGLLVAAIDRFTADEAEDYTSSSWEAFAAALDSAQSTAADPAANNDAWDAARTALEDAAGARVQVSGLRDLATRYATYVPSDYTAATWAPFAAALTAATDTVEDPAASASAVVTAKNALQDAAATLATVSAGDMEGITNNEFWHDTDGNPIFSQGGGIFRFGDRYYWYGVKYTGAQQYYDNPTRTYDATFASITAYSSTDLVNWTFENDIATTDTAVHIPASKDVNGSYFSDMETLGDSVWIGRLGVVYNENTGKYVLLTQFENQDPARVTNAGTLFLSGDSPTADFTYANLQTHIPGVYNNGSGYDQGTGDQTVFTDDDGSDYLVFSYRSGRSRTYVARISDSDSLSIENAVQVFAGAGREGNAMFKLDDRYYIASSDLHGWNTSQTYIVRSLTDDIQGAYSGMYVLPGTERDYSHVTQSGFFVTVHGTEQDTVIYAGDRWADFAYNGLGYNQWVPLSGTGENVTFNSLSDWNLNATTGAWEVGFRNNYVLNPDFAADRIAVTTVTGWEQSTEPSSSTTGFVSNVSPGADATRFGLRLGADVAFAGDVHQDVDIPAGVYQVALTADRPAGLTAAQVVVTDSSGVAHAFDITPTTGWAKQAFAQIVLPAGTTRVAVRAVGDGGAYLKADALSLRQQAVDTTALTDEIAAAADLEQADYAAAGWTALTDALADAEDVAGSTATQEVVDDAASRLADARGALISALTSVEAKPTSSLAALGSDASALGWQMTATFADGSTRVLDADEYAAAGLDTSVEGDQQVTLTVDAGLHSAVAGPVATVVTVTVLPAWDATATYSTGDEVIVDGARWVASWWTRAQHPGDVYGPWQEVRVDADGTAVWTPTRVFLQGAIVRHEDTDYRARWWTRGQEPGGANGPWEAVS